MKTDERNYFTNFTAPQKAGHYFKMALEEFEKEQLTERDKGYIRMRSIMDMGMGILWAGMGGFFLFAQKLSPALTEQYDAKLLMVFGSVCVLYGLFRVYRGIKKNYLRR